MSTSLNPYISFQDNARQAMEFYKSVFGGELTLSTYGEGGMQESHPGEDDKIMHAQLVTTTGMVFMAADTPNSMTSNGGTQISISLSGDDKDALTSYYNGLVEGGAVNEPLAEAPWGDWFGMITDKFGINWMVNISPISE
ncbi:VOC family protein [bacterium]|nr:MAG: VOC family protein [bacterium]